MVIIYGSPKCSYCEMALDLVNRYQLDYEYFSVTDVENQIKFRELFPEAKTIPQIVWNGNHVGGYTEFASEVENTINNYGEGDL